MQSSYKLLFVGGCFYIWFKKWIRNRGRPSLAGKTTEGGAAEPAFEPFVLVQIPMRNERECFKRSIEAACKLDWPQDKLVIQVHSSKNLLHSNGVLAKGRISCPMFLRC